MDFQAILDEAYTKAKAASEASYEKIGERDACGFAWVKLDGKSKLANYCRKQIKAKGLPDYGHKFGSKGYPGGWQFWNPGQHSTQSVSVKEAGAFAFVNALREHGIDASYNSRLD